jgi:hypothetical protein
MNVNGQLHAHRRSTPGENGSPQCTFHRRMGGPQSRSVNFGNKANKILYLLSATQGLSNVQFVSYFVLLTVYIKKESHSITYLTLVTSGLLKVKGKDIPVRLTKYHAMKVC